jgi:Flp pilus assembly secretin CpaC
MLLHILTLGTVLLAMQTVSAEDTPASSHPSIPHQPNACPTQDPPHPSGDILDTTVSGYMSKDATCDEQQLLLQQKCAELDRLQREVKQLRAATGTAQQILVKVQMLEVSLTKLRNMGMDTDWFANGYIYEAKIRQLLDATGGRADKPMAEPVAKAESNDSLRFVDWLKQNNLAKVLSEPTLVTVSGRAASVSVGGEFPVPAINDSKTAVDFRNFGTELNLLALALGDNQVHLEVNTRVSAVDYNHAIEISGARIPGLKVRQCDTGFELSFGQTAMLTGLVEQRTEAHQVDGGRTKEVLVDVGLMVVVTPELVPPLEVPAASANRDNNRAKKK